MAGRFIVFEGIDGAGKSTLINRVSEILGSEGVSTVVTAEPTDGPVGKLIRSGAVKCISQDAEALLFTADRACHTAEIIKWKDEGKTVLCDRYYASTMAYQSANFNGTESKKEWLKELNRPVIIEPDITILLDVDPEEGMRRVGARGARSKYEVAVYLERVRENYRQIAEEYGFRIIDASHSRDEVLKETMKIIGE
ncbi:MAG: dTMP kinase [Candidatus Methanomethylophilaceae archaeon]|nr:dTMP kinase [Candidatus Methanomethylophilaceae archaeon]